MELAEDVVQDTLLKALQQWGYQGVPQNPRAWLYQVAKNRALDVIRHDKLNSTHSSEIKKQFGQETAELLDNQTIFDSGEIKDDQLRMIFSCCHPSLSIESQVALTLKTLCGFSIAEIAHAFLSSEETITKRLYRAREKLREEKIAFEIPTGWGFASRLGSVLSVIYLLFNEGYSSSNSDTHIREDLCEEAIRLCILLSEHPAGNNPQSYALLALMCFNAARFDARVDDHGSIILLKEQDRSKWNNELINQGIKFLAISSEGENFSSYHAEAAIAAAHSLSPTYELTDWKMIVQLYDLLLGMKKSQVIELNRAIAIGQLNGPQQLLEELNNLHNLNQYYLFHAAKGDAFLQLKDYENARLSFLTAFGLTSSKPEKELLTRKLKECSPNN